MRQNSKFLIAVECTNYDYLMNLIHENAENQCIWWDDCQNRCTVHIGHCYENPGTLSIERINRYANRNRYRSNLLVDFHMDTNCFMHLPIDLHCTFRLLDRCLHGLHGHIEMLTNCHNVHATAHKMRCTKNKTR